MNTDTTNLMKTLIINQIKRNHIVQIIKDYFKVIPFLIECDLHYLDKVILKSKHLPLLPINRAINYEELSDYQRKFLLNKVNDHNEEKARKLLGKDKKLILNFYDKERYVIYYEMLKHYLK